MSPVVRDDKKMMETPADWPMWPKLPLKRLHPVTGFIQLGVMVAVEDQLTTVFTVSLFEEINTNETPKIVYDDIDALLADNWVVD